MRTLSQTLQDHDRAHLEIIAQLWGLDLPKDQYADWLSIRMLDQTPQILEDLPGGAQRALDRLIREGGRIQMEALIRQFGPLREMGPSKRDRLKPWKEPASALEMLWYRGLMARAFADSGQGPQEYGFVPDDLLVKLPKPSDPETRPLGEPAAAPRRVVQSYGHALDDATTVLAAHRRGDISDLGDHLHQPTSLSMLNVLLEETGVDGDPDRTRDFLKRSRVEAIELLQHSWENSTLWNDLSRVPGIESPKGEWPNDPVASRRAALRRIESVPFDTWWSISSLVGAIYESDPGFLRPPGGFDSWYLQSSEDASSLRGFEAWDRVERPYLEHLITGPMLWLGVSELSADGSSFRLVSPPDLAASDTEGRAVAWPDGRIRVARGANRALRYQFARLCEWERMDAGAYHYRLTAQSLAAARSQGLTAKHALKVLDEVDAPESLVQAVKRWDKKGQEASVSQQLILQVKDREVLKMLLDHPTTKRFLGRQLGATSVAIDARQWPKLREAALRLGLFIGGST